MFLMKFGVQEMAVSRVQVAKLCQDKFSQLIFAVWDSFMPGRIYLLHVALSTKLLGLGPINRLIDYRSISILSGDYRSKNP